MLETILIILVVVVLAAWVHSGKRRKATDPEKAAMKQAQLDAVRRAMGHTDQTDKREEDQ